MIVRVPSLAGLGGEVAYTAQLVNGTAPALQSVAGKAVDFGVYMWAGLSAALVIWALNASPGAKHRREEIKRAKQGLSKARRLPRVGV